MNNKPSYEELEQKVLKLEEDLKKLTENEDKTQRNQIEKSFMDSDSQFKSILENDEFLHLTNMLRIKDNALRTAINGIAFGDLKGAITYVNESFVRMWGFSSIDDVIGKHVSVFWENQLELSKVLSEISEKGSYSGDLRAVRKNGTIFDAHISASMIKDEKGNNICQMASFIDISKIKETEKELRETKEYWEKLINSDLVIWNDFKPQFLDNQFI